MVLLSSSNQIMKRNVLASSMMFILSPIFMRWSAPLIFKTDDLTVSPDGVHLFNINLHSVVCPHRSITMFKRLNPDKDVLQVQQHSHLLLEFTRSWLSLNNIAPNVIWMCLFIDYLSLSHIVLRSPILYLIIFLCPPAELNTICFPSQSPLYCPKVSQLFKEYWEELMSFLSRISQTQWMFFFVWQSFFFWNQISYFKGHVYSSLIVEMKSERYQFWKRSFKNQAFW